MSFIRTALLAALPLALAQVDPPGTPFPNTTYPNATDPYTDAGAQWNQTSPPSYPSPWGTGLGDWADAYKSAQAFVSGLTLIEKVNLTTGVGWQSQKCVGNSGGIPRLGFKALCLQDSPLGVRDTDFNSAFPAGITAGATWDRSSFYQRGFDMGTEHKLKGTDIQLGPVVGPIGRSPEAGRNWEGFSSDPVLAGIAAAETIKGMQAAGIMACIKHFVGNEQEHFRQGSPPSYLTAAISSNIDDVTMHELYLWPFADAVRAGAASLMCSYQQVNNSYACQNSYTLNHLLKNELGFQGFVMSDWSAQHSGVSSALAGMDMTMPGDIQFNSGTSYWGSNLTIAVLNGTVPQWRLDDMATRIVAAWYYVDRQANQVPNAPTFSSWTLDTYGFEHHYAQDNYELVNYHVDVRGDHAANIREIAAKGTVLLKNTNAALPLTGKERLTAVFGSDAGVNLNGPNGCGDRGCDNGTLAMGWGSGTANFPYLVTPLEAIKNQVLSQGATVESVTDDYATGAVLALARRVPDVNGVCIVFANSDSGEGYIVVDGNEGDRNNLTLWHDGNGLIQQVTSMCNNTVVVMHTVGPVLVDEWHANPNVTAIIWAGLPGQESGNSLADILYGRVNPGGKSTFTWGSYRGQYGADVLYEPNNGDLAPQDSFSEGIFIDYKQFDRQNVTPIFEFGFGLSYTTFSFSDLAVQAHGIPAYTPTTGDTAPAPTYGSISNDSSDYLYPAGFTPVKAYIYPFLTSSDLGTASGDPEYGTPYDFPAGSSDGSPQPYLAAGSSTAPGGNQALYDVLFTVTATITNTGPIVGDEVPQLYVSLGGPNDPKVQLRNFDRLTIAAGATATFTADVTRRDLSNWDTITQNWVITNYTKTVYVGNSSRNLPLSAVLDLSGSGSTSPVSTSSASGSSASGSAASGSTVPASSATVGAVSASSAGSSATSVPESQPSSHGGWPWPQGPPQGPPQWGPGPQSWAGGPPSRPTGWP